MTSVPLVPNGPFDPDVTVRMLAAHTIPGGERTDVALRSHTRLLTHAAGHVRVELLFTEDAVVASIPDQTPDAASLLSVIRRWLDLDSDIVKIADYLRHDATIGPLIDRRPGIRLIGYPDEFEAVVATVIGQQVSLAAARTFMGRLVAAYGTPIAELSIFPTPQKLASIPGVELQAVVGLTGARTRTLRTVAEKWADGFSFTCLTVDEARRALLALPGIGPWTADYLTVRALQHPDTFAPGDLVARKALGAITAAQASKLAARWAPWRSYALVHLWADAAYGTTQPPSLRI